MNMKTSLAILSIFISSKIIMKNFCSSNTKLVMMKTFHGQPAWLRCMVDICGTSET